MGIAALIFPEDIPALRSQARAVPDEAVTAHTALGVQRAGDSKYIPSLLQGRGGGDERAALFRRFHHQGGQAQATENPVPGGKMPAKGLRPRRILRQKHAGGGHVLIESVILRRIYHVHAAAQHGGRQSAGAQCPQLRCRSNAPGQTRDHQAALLAHFKAEALRRADAVGRAAPGAHHRHGGLLVK